MGKKLLDSSVWIEILGSGPLSKSCLKELKSAELVVVPTLVIYEVYRKITQSASDDQALSAISNLTQHSVVELSQDVALTAADLSLQYKLGMADSFVLAHAQRANATLVTLDNDFAGTPNTLILRR